MSQPVKYTAALPAATGPCGLCGDASALVLNDHCHQHGWLRGTLCASCNIKLGHAEARGMVGEHLGHADALAWLARCPDCVPDLAPWSEAARPVMTTLRVRPVVADNARRLGRRLAATADRDITQADAIGAAIGYALDHLADVAGLLPAPPALESALSDRAPHATAGK